MCLVAELCFTPSLSLALVPLGDQLRAPWLPQKLGYIKEIWCWGLLVTGLGQDLQTHRSGPLLSLGVSHNGEREVLGDISILKDNPCS